jgi:hypothetical protein
MRLTPEQNRERWRREIHGMLMSDARLLDLVSGTTQRMTDLPDPPRVAAVKLAGELLDWACDKQARASWRDTPVRQHIAATLWNFLKEHSTKWAATQAARTDQNTQRPLF